MKKIAFLIFLNIISSALSQQKAIDSMRTIVKSSVNDSVTMSTYNQLRRATYYNNPDTSKYYTKKYLEYARKQKDSHNIVLAHFFLGNAKLIEGDYKKALSDYLVGAQYYEKKKDSARLTSVLNSLGAVYEKMENDSLSLYYYKQARTLAKELKDYRRSGIASINIGNIYNNQGDAPTAITYLEDAIDALDDNPAYQSFLTLGYINLADAYGKNNQTEQAKKSYQTALAAIDTVAQVYNYGNVLRGLAIIYTTEGDAQKALPLAQKAERIFATNNFVDERLQTIPSLLKIYKATANHEKAVSLYEEFLSIRDSIFNAEQDKNITDAIQKYETEKKDAQLKVLALENEKAEEQRRLYLYLALSGLVVATLIGFFLYKNSKKNTLLAKQKRLLEATVDEKNVLLKETHHRVKNSFQIVSSLLYLQSENLQDKEGQLALKEAQNRVRSMVLIHQKLYSKDQLVGIDTREYISDLIRDILESYQQEGKPITYELNIDSIVLSIETITPLGLILNELITNALKHAFTITSEEKILTISLHKKDEKLLLKVGDTGKGMPETIDEGSFGIQLIRSLAKKLKATLVYSENTPKGTLATLTMNRFEEL